MSRQSRTASSPCLRLLDHTPICYRTCHLRPLDLVLEPVAAGSRGAPEPAEGARRPLADLGRPEEEVEREHDGAEDGVLRERAHARGGREGVRVRGG